MVERDPTYARASTTLSMSNVRIQFSLRENIQISQYAFQVLDRFEDEMTVEDCRPRIYFHREGNLFLVSAANQDAARRAFELQRSLGCRIEWWSPQQIRDRYPLYAPGEEIVGATFGPDDGHFDAYAALMAYRAKAKSRGAEFLTGEAVKIRAEGGRATGVDLGSGDTLAAACVVNCGGAWAADLAATIGVKLPVVPVKRQIFTLDTAVKPDGPLPLTVLLSGLYLPHRDRRHDPAGEIHGRGPGRLQLQLGRQAVHGGPLAGAGRVRPRLGPAQARPRLGRPLRRQHARSQRPIIGEWPEIRGLYLATGFSGHGLQQGPAVGRYLSELILKRQPALDLSIFTPARVLENRPLSEAGIV